MEVVRFPNSLHKRGGDPACNRSGKYQLTSCAAGARSGNGLPGHPSSQAGGGQQPIQARHGIVDPGSAASHKGRTGVLDPAGTLLYITKWKTKKKMLAIVLRSLIFTF